MSYHVGGQVDVVRPDKLPLPTGNLYCSIFTTQQKVKKLWDSCNKKYTFTTENIDFYEYVPSQIIFIKEVKTKNISNIFNNN